MDPTNQNIIDIKDTRFDVVGFGHPILDVTLEVADDFLSHHEFLKGEMHLVDVDKSTELLKLHGDIKAHCTAGGSAANTLACISQLGAKTLLVGKVGNDELGTLYLELAHKDGVLTDCKTDATPQGICKVFTTEDKERTFATYLGASQTLTDQDIDLDSALNTKVVHFEGFLLDSAKQVVFDVAALAKQKNVLVSLDLADVGVITRHRDDMEKLLDYVDILFANETETQEYTGTSFENSLDIMKEKVMMSVLKRGKHGSTIIKGDEMVRVPAQLVEVKNLNGAGDAYAGGFLWSYLKGHDLHTVGKIAALCGAKAVESTGARIEDTKLKEEVEDLV